MGGHIRGGRFCRLRYGIDKCCGALRLNFLGLPQNLILDRGAYRLARECTDRRCAGDIHGNLPIKNKILELKYSTGRFFTRKNIASGLIGNWPYANLPSTFVLTIGKIKKFCKKCLRSASEIEYAWFTLQSRMHLPGNASTRLGMSKMEKEERVEK